MRRYPAGVLPLVLAAALSLAPSPCQDGADGAAPLRDVAWPVLELDLLERWRERVRPGAEELRFEAVDWAPSFAAGLQRAAQEGKPLLLWAMNGHPLGCT